jgi:hypothetical protein
MYYFDIAPADVKLMTDTMFPAYIRTPLVAPVFASVKSFVLFISAFEAAIVLAFFYRPHFAAVGTLAVMAGAEYVGLATAMTGRGAPSHPMCAGAGPVCAATQGVHVVIAAIAGLVFAKAAPLCRQVVLGWGAVKGAPTPGRSVRNTTNPYANNNRRK